MLPFKYKAISTCSVSSIPSIADLAKIAYLPAWPDGTTNLLFVQTSKVFDLDATDYIEAFLYHNEGDGRSAENTRSLFYGYKLIG